MCCAPRKALSLSVRRPTAPSPPDDVGLGWTIGGGDFVGRRSLSLPDLSRSGSQAAGRVAAGRSRGGSGGRRATRPGTAEHVRAQTRRPVPKPLTISMQSILNSAIGHVTSSYRSATLGRGFALALVAGGRARIGSELLVPMPGSPIRVTVAAPIFLDKSAERLKSRPVPPGPANRCCRPSRSRRSSLVRAVQCN